MRKEAYERIFACIQKTRYGVKIINGISTAITYVTAVLYFSVLFWLVWQESYCDACVTIAVPAVSFILVSVFRAKLNARRPYEVYQFQPLIPKDKCGNSFPSRHVFSIFVIRYDNCLAVYVGSSDRLGFGYRPCGDSCGRWRTFSKRCDRRNVYRYHFGSSLPVLFVLISGNSKRE